MYLLYLSAINLSILSLKFVLFILLGFITGPNLLKIHRAGYTENNIIIIIVAGRNRPTEHELLLLSLSLSFYIVRRWRRGDRL